MGNRPSASTKRTKCDSSSPTWRATASQLPIAPLHRAQATAPARPLGHRKRADVRTNAWQRMTRATLGTTAAAVITAAHINQSTLRKFSKPEKGSADSQRQLRAIAGAIHGRVRGCHVVKAAVSKCVRGRPLVKNAFTMAESLQRQGCVRSPPARRQHRRRTPRTCWPTALGD